MLVPTAEQVKVAAEMKAKEAGAVASKTDAIESSKLTDTTTSEEETQAEATGPDPKPYKVFRTEDEYNLDLEKASNTRAQSMKDKELSPLQTKISELTKEKSKLEKLLKFKKEDFALEDMEDAEAEAWGDKPKHDVEDFQKARRQLIKDMRELEEFKAEAKEENDKVVTSKDALENERLAVKHLLGDKGDEFSKQYEAIIKELAGCKTTREKELTLRVMGGNITVEEKPKPEKKPALTRTDSGRHTAPGGASEDLQELLKIDTRKMSYSQLQEHKAKINKLRKQ